MNMSVDVRSAGAATPGQVALHLIGEVYRARPKTFVVFFLLLLGSGAVTGVYIAAIAGITNALIANDTRRAVLWILAWGAANLFEASYWVGKSYWRQLLADHATDAIQRRLFTCAADAPLAAYEDGNFFGLLERAGDNLGDRLRELIVTLTDLTQLLAIALSLVAVFLGIWPPLLPILLAGLVPALLIERRVAILVHRVRQRHARTDRLLQRLGDVIGDRDAAAELRVFANGPDLVHRWRSARRGRADDVLVAERTRSVWNAGGEAVQGLAIAIVLGLVVWLMIDRRLSLGAWVAATQGVEWSIGILGGLAYGVRAWREQSAYLSDLYEFERYAAQLTTHDRARQAHAADVPASGAIRRGPIGISARDVSFAYPGNERLVVERVSLDIAPGERVAIVGENGAGKTTLVRLLAGLYVPQGGNILLDGIATCTRTAEGLRPRVAAVFQDFVAYQLTVRENVALGRLDAMSDDAALLTALAKAGIGDLVNELPDGLDAYLGRQFGERDLSGGQWQRIALARAFFRDADLLILDEPTAALDPMAEQALFERFAHLTHGKTALMISHRLGIARFADRIVVMEDGAVVEQGSHAELIARQGRYAAMFAAQASWYQ